MAESKTPEANYKGRTDIVHADDTTLSPLTDPLVRADTRTLLTTVKSQHTTKMDAEVTAAEARAATAFGGNQTTGNIKRGK